ncbi:sensor histidine kinase [Pleionea mediterranea]|jgi:signal transduction histidine kinase|uniref:histidine kinase n=1 Tax=Pleionea mediterranea TaxID=523701 RepID=A0A316FQH4_9GAMM|nr:HAMP domain-containing sensor histidine kinase [Pleionea mediterranea]PWK49956.1 signal transduction histidine kinase [Pleionea mediterranea]
MNDKHEHLDFSMVLASAVHDMKNSLSILISAISALERKYPAIDDEDKKQHSVLQYESSRLNSDLVQLLGLYKLENKQLPLNVNYHDVEDFLSDQVAQYEPLLKSRDIELELDIEEELDGCFDVDLIASILNNVLGNAIRYTKNTIRISAYYDNGLVIDIADDGIGYPEFMLKEQENFIKSIDHSTGSTGLGLYFAGQIARLHKQGENKGTIKLLNGGELKGGIFRLTLP